MNWLRNAIRRWLGVGAADTPPAPPSPILDVRWGGNWVPVRATGVVGTRLLVDRVDGKGSGAVHAGQARDPAQFKQLWAQLGGGTAYWADGTPAGF